MCNRGAKATDGRAAFLRGQNLTEFMVAVLSEPSMQIITDYELLQLTDRARQAFADALLNLQSISAIALILNGVVLQKW